MSHSSHTFNMILPCWPSLITLQVELLEVVAHR